VKRQAKRIATSRSRCVARASGSQVIFAHAIKPEQHGPEQQPQRVMNQRDDSVLVRHHVVTKSASVADAR
jgi:hypothetical protein